MKNMFTLKRFFLWCFLVVAGMGASNPVSGQAINWATFGFPPAPAPPATFENVPANSVIGFLPAFYNDNIIQQYPRNTDSFSFVNTGTGKPAMIKVWWNFPNPVNEIRKIVFYKNQRRMTSCYIVRYDAQNNVYDTLGYYYNPYTDVADSFFIRIPINDAPFIDTIYFADILGPEGNPDFREIQLWAHPPVAACLAGPDIIGGVEQEPYSAGPGFGPNTINICPGYSAYMGGVSQADSNMHYYQWQINNGTGWVNIPGATNIGYVYDGVISATFRLMDSCAGSAAAVPSTNTLQVNVSPNYLPLTTAGYVMTFEPLWQQSPCLPAHFAPTGGSGDMPGANWSSNDPYGFYSWRVDSITNYVRETTYSATPPTPVLTWKPSSWANTSNKNPNPTSSIPYGVNFGTNNRYARAHTTHGGFDTVRSANLDLYLDLSSSTVAGDKALTFYYLNSGPINFDTLKVWMSTNAGQSWTHLGTYDTAIAWKKRFLPIPSNSPQTIIRFQASKPKAGVTGSDIGLDSVFVAAPCTGTPVAGSIKSNLGFAKTVSVCPGTSLELTTLGSTIAGNLVFEWQHSFDLGNTYTPVNGGFNSNSLFFQTPPIYDTVMYRLALKCGPSGTVVYSDALRVNLSSPGPTYASIPYRQNFESWGNGCSTGDIILSQGNARHWTNSPGVGSNSWRRSLPDPTTAIWPLFNNIGWSNIPYLTQNPVPKGGGQYAARFHSNGTYTNHRGNLDLLFNGSAIPGDKELRFFYVNPGGNDSMQVYYSVDSGRNFTRLASYKTANTWSQHTLQIPCSSPKCVIRFEGSGELSNQSDIGLDSVTLYPPCTGSPSAGILTTTDTLPCPLENFTLSLENFSVTGGLTFTWYSRPASSPFWQLAQQDTTKTYFETSITVPTWYKVVVRCRYSGQVDSVERLINVAAFYYCYCTSAATNPSGVDIGNVNIKRLPAGTNLLNNGNPLPQNNNNSANGSYADYRIGNPAGWLPIIQNPPSTYPTPIYHDTSYQILISQINSGNFSPATITVWIDTDRNGLFDTDEMFLRGTTSLTSTPPQRIDAPLVLPPTTPTGFTGMRVMIEAGSNVNSVPCGPIANGEVEDYLIEVRDHPCTGPASAGTVVTKDSAVCAGYSITLIDTSHATKEYGLRWVWQSSPDSNSWADISGSLGKDTVNPIVTAQTWYRVRMVCLMTFDTTYSNVVKVAINPPYACYCYSQAIGAAKDSSDIGGMAVTGTPGKGFFVPSVGPHLLNPWALKERTDYTKDSVLHLYLDSTYQLLVYHTMNTPTHADAKVTLFIDLNNNGLYDITANPFTNERMWTGFTTSNYFTLVDSITIPGYGIPGVPTGMRLILNNDTGPNAPSDSACGPYFSGETEDFVVMLHNAASPWPSLGVNPVSNINNFYVYPNPTNGKFYVKFDAVKPVDEATITVTNVTGQQVVGRHISNPGKALMEEIDITNLARGVYVVELRADNERFLRKLVVK